MPRPAAFGALERWFQTPPSVGMGVFTAVSELTLNLSGAEKRERASVLSLHPHWGNAADRPFLQEPTFVDFFACLLFALL